MQSINHLIFIRYETHIRVPMERNGAGRKEGNKNEERATVEPSSYTERTTARTVFRYFN